MSAPQATVKVYLLGGFHLERDGRPARLNAMPTELLLAYLALHAERPVRRTQLGEVIWGMRKQKKSQKRSPTNPDERIQAALRVALTNIRQTLGPEVLLKGLQIDNKHAEQLDLSRIWVDALDFQQRASDFLDTPNAEPEHAPVELYQGDLLDGSEDNPEEPWIAPWRESLRELYQDLLLGLSDRLRERSDFAQSLARAEQVTTLDALNARACYNRMFALWKLGQHDAALALCDQFDAQWKKAFGYKQEFPDTLTQLYYTIEQARRPVYAPTLKTNLPKPRTALIGRTAEIARIKRYFAPETDATPPAPLVTLTGLGGSGKTRLAIEAAGQLLERYADEGVWWVELEALRDESQVIRQIARTLGVREQSGQELLETVTNYLREKKLLLVVDNCEHLLTECARVFRHLLLACASLQILATSRERLGLHLDGEVEIVVPSLGFPKAEQPLLADLRQFEAVRLFMDRAQMVRPNYALGEGNAPHVVTICRRLDGIPLALALAAAQLKPLSIETLAQRLDDRFSVLVDRHHFVPRHQTLQATIDWSYDLLEVVEQRVFQQLGTFAGSFTLEAAEDVCGSSVGKMRVYEVLQSLIDKSLVEVHVAETAQGEKVRYRLLETIRAYAREKLKESRAEADAAFARMAGYYLKFAKANQKNYLALEEEWENISLGIRVTHRQKQWRGLIAFGNAINEGCIARGFYTEARQLYPWICEAAWAEEDQNAYISATLNMSRVSIDQSDYQTAAEFIARALKVSEEVDDLWGISEAQYLLGWLAFKQSNYDEAKRYLANSLKLKERLEDATGMAEVFFRQSAIEYNIAQYDLAQELAKKALAIQESINDQRGSTHTLRSLAMFANVQGNLDLAEAYGLRALELCRATKSQHDLADVYYALAGIYRRQKKLETAHTFAADSLGIFQRLGDRQSQGLSLFEISRVDFEMQENPRALQAAEESVKIFSSIQDNWMKVLVLRHLGDIALAMLQKTRATEVWSEALNLAEKLKHPAAGSVLERLNIIAGAAS